MKLDRRLKNLECATKPKFPDGAAAANLCTHLETIGERLSGGCLDDNPASSVAERVALAFERGDAEMAKGLLLRAVGRNGHQTLSLEAT